MNAVSLWFDGGGTMGFGNVRRTLELGERLRDAGFEVGWRPLSEGAALLSRRPFGFPHAQSASLVILDVPYAGDALVEEARRSQAKVVALDYEGTASPDLVISLQNWRALPRDVPFRCGPEFSIIRKEISELKTARTRGEEVLVIAGGGDQAGLSVQIADCLPNERLCVIQGPNGEALDLERAGVRVRKDPPDLPRLMAGCEWAVTTGGTTMLELLCLGKAVHVIPRTAAERAFASRFFDEGALLGLGLESLKRPENAVLDACERRGAELIDGRGCERIIAEISQLG